jgi:prevent-host-death family protein
MSWSIIEARQHFHRIVARAEEEGLQVVTRHGMPFAVVITPAQWRQLTKRFDALTQEAAEAKAALLNGSPSQGQA